MINLRIHHRTTYRYRHEVRLGPHRLMLRPREWRDVRLISSKLMITPEVSVTLAHDVMGNALATASFHTPADTLVIDNTAEVELCAVVYPIFDIAISAHSFPFRYEDDEWTDLGSLTARQYPDSDPSLETWARKFVGGCPTDTLSLLKDLNAGVGALDYQAREDEGTQSPSQTLSHGSGSSRDLATLFVEAARCLGFGVRDVSGYLYDPTRTLLGSADRGSTHAWAEVYLPGAGWISFEPTNRSVGGANLIPVAVTRDVRQAIPVLGTFLGPSGVERDMSVEVSVTS